jgi:hypothetical protein
VADEKKTRPVEWFNLAVLVAGIPFLFWGAYYQMVTANAASNAQTPDVNKKFETLQTSMNEMQERVVKLETLTKLASDVTALQAKVSELQTRYTTPTENKSLADFSGLLANQQRQWSTALMQHPLDSPLVQSLPEPPSSLPPDLSWLKDHKEDAESLHSLLGRTDEHWKPPTFTPTPLSDLLASSPPEKPFPENIWEIVKAYPVLAIFLAILLISAVGKAVKK